MPALEVPLFLPLPPGLLHSHAQSGVSRFELCSGPYSSGGLTPTLSDIGAAISAIVAGAASGTAPASDTHTDVAVHVMLRPRGGSFVYSATEIESMKSDIERFALLGVEGVVFGVLRETMSSEEAIAYSIDASACRVLVDEAKRLGLRAVFHRAFDEVEDWKGALETLRDCGVSAVLTAGGKGSAKDGVERLTEMLPLAKNMNIGMIVGGGVRSTNVRTLRETLPDVELWHSAAIVDGGEVPSEEEVKQLVTALREANG
jgi:copper homeostasis protein